MTDPFVLQPSARLIPFRRRSARSPTGQQRYDRLLADIEACDTDLVPLVNHRRDLVRQLNDLIEACWPASAEVLGYRPPVADELPMPDAAHDAEPLWGSRLRSIVLTLLGRYGTCSLRTLHCLLLTHGFVLASRRPVKALADALNHEVHRGRVVRVDRGTYKVHPQFHPRRGRFGNVTLVREAPWESPRPADDLPSPVTWK